MKPLTTPLRGKPTFGTPLIDNAYQAELQTLPTELYNLIEVGDVIRSTSGIYYRVDKVAHCSFKRVESKWMEMRNVYTGIEYLVYRLEKEGLL